MPQHLLNRPEIGSPVEQVGRRAVPQGVGTGRDAPGKVGREPGDQ